MRSTDVPGPADLTGSVGAALTAGSVAPGPVSAGTPWSVPAPVPARWCGIGRRASAPAAVPRVEDASTGGGTADVTSAEAGAVSRVSRSVVSMISPPAATTPQPRASTVPVVP